MAVKTLAQRQNTIVICTIHQPNWQTFRLFDTVLLLAKGRTMYRGPIGRSKCSTMTSLNFTAELLPGYLDKLGYPVGEHVNPADAAISLVNTDFDHPQNAADFQESKLEAGDGLLENLADKWIQHEQNSGSSLVNSISTSEIEGPLKSVKHEAKKASFMQIIKRDIYRTGVLIGRNFTNYRRNLLAYGIRVGMYSECSAYPNLHSGDQPLIN